MRRARIKAAAVVPVRRKPQQAAVAEPSTEKSALKPQESAEKNVDPIETISTQVVEEKIDIKIETFNNLEEVVLSPVKDKEPVIKESSVNLNESIVVAPDINQNESTEFQHSDANNDSQVTNHVQSVKSSESPEKAKTPVNTESVKKLEMPTKTEKFPASSVESSPVKSMQSPRSHFTRPSPRLDGGGRVRRNSIQGSGASASESEDDSRRSISIAPSRIRNDSVCSVQSLKDTSNTNCVAAKLNVGQKRRMVVSESARKLAEARREFNLKHENKTPTHDKSSLTMYDLIYYNPITNPMKPKPAARKLSVCSVVEKNKEEEIADDTSGMPVPQVKVGPNGELIIDEQSLVIDQYKVQDNIDRTNILVVDDNTGNGFYKKRQKSKDWNKWETLMFYKALNTYGTDFLLMQSTFPSRTRTELKLKYKKEEKINPNLVEKALRYQEFDTEALKEDLANVEENQKKEFELKRKAKKDNSLFKRKRRRCKIVSDEVTGDTQNEHSGNISDENQSSEDVRITITTKKVRKRRRRKTKTSEIMSDKNNKDDSESNSEVYSVKPTRFGRTPKKPRRVSKSIKICDVQEKKPRGRPRKKKVIPNDNKEKEGTNTMIEVIETQDMQINELNSSNIIENNKIANIVNIEENKETANNIQIKNEVTPEISEIGSKAPNMKLNLKPGSLVVLKKNSQPGERTLQVYIVSDDYDTSNHNYKKSLLPIDTQPKKLQTVTNCIDNMLPHNTS